MAKPLGLTLHTLTARREATHRPRPPRPDGRLVWLHAPQDDSARTLAELARRVHDDLGDEILLTGIGGSEQVGDDTPAEARAFLDHWRPDLAVFAGGELRPALTAAIAERRIPLMMVDAAAPSLAPGIRRWPGLLRSTLRHFDQILALDEAAATAYRRAGASAKVAGRMEEPHLVLPCTEAERAEIARVIAGRPVWLAAALPEGEEEAIIAAHRSVLHQSHRLLLIIVPAATERAAPLARRLEEMGLVVGSRVEEDEILPETEVYIADNPDEFGLWYRIAPICYLGGSLSSGTIRDPLEAAALGSAVIHGPKAGQFAAIFARLRGATLPIPRPHALGDALSDLMAPDRVAKLASAAWDAASDGSEVTDRVIALIDRMMEDR